ncbi:MAG: asparagine synthase (glutamine-hydrolyzing) [Blastocatellia bacterium]|nr:asparagine synthase (glutamine-hydrolyzing) [Blastocatellia bacterium]
MCGIAGFISRDRGASLEPREALLDRMCKVIAYRGPDEQGMVVRGRAALGMRRLSIIDLEGGQQPIYTEDGNLAIVFNGEIYNFRELRRELESLGHRFRSKSDTEVVVHAFEEYGVDCLSKLRGMFAFAIWNFREETLFIARDRVGKKPLFYSQIPNGDFVFGSELKTLLVHGGLTRSIDKSALDAYLTFGYVPEEFCIFEGVRKLPPGHYVVLKNGETSVRQYWDFKFDADEPEQSEEYYVRTLREKLEEAVRVRMISDVPLGAFLSGGVDSSTVVAYMSKLSDTPVKTFSIGFNEDSFDELKYARVAAKHFGTEHHEFVVTPDLVEIIDELVWHFDEPFADSSALPTFMVSKLAREYVTVVLSGDGGDELFGGYTRYTTNESRDVFARLPHGIRTGVLQKLSMSLPHGAPGKNYLYNIGLAGNDRYIDSISHFNGPRRRALYAKGYAEELNGTFGIGEELYRKLADAVGGGSAIDKLLYLDSKTYLPGDILTKVDRMSMANSLEARVPLLDHKLIEFVMTIPSTLKMNGSVSKYILKKAMEGTVPNEILHRSKQGFGVPIGEWIKQQLRARIVSDLRDQRTRERGYFDEKYIDTLLDEHQRNRRDHSHELWMLWMLELWHRRYVDDLTFI